jgi:hypothetical protein
MAFACFTGKGLGGTNRGLGTVSIWLRIKVMRLLSTIMG